jgi:hypothetical protein
LKETDFNVVGMAQVPHLGKPANHQNKYPKYRALIH